MSESIPRVSIGLAVRNGQGSVERCIESILRQNFKDFEIVISDNASDDGTAATIAAYARADRRIRLHVNEVNIGLHENMNRVLRLSRGTFFRWISADDWLEQGCLSACVEALEARAEAIGVTTGFTAHEPAGAMRYEDFRGEFPTSPDPSRRFERMLWFYHAGDAKYDPVYGMYRRTRLMETGLVRRSERTDWLLSAELALKGPIIHLADRFANRTRTSLVGCDRAALRRRLDPIRSEDLKTSPGRTYGDLLDLAVSANLTDAQLHRCRVALRRFWVKEMIRVARSRLADARHRSLGG
ncbi:glycosyltransferase family A protein [Mesorhizobium sp. BAC0120]|uniref:glycosyltransferase family 2 protein n=1 Tax=Mesorhizobium sp. BAC0120 TaxID=3090670 RepID=UPI00298CD1E1|nr:glycosyltransferase family A protein [Mesorhizobium sp. BAC0120]MDW6021582.1 glycosyltransferase family A protein [Mesorhizobium sp. BAC0120]